MRTRKILKTLKNCRAKRRVHVSICMSKIMCTPISRHIYVCDIHWLSNPGLWIYPSTYYVKGSCQIIKLCSLCVEIGFVVLHINNYIYIIYNIYIYIYILYIYIYTHYGIGKTKLNSYMLLRVSCISNRQAYIMFILSKKIK